MSAAVRTVERYTYQPEPPPDGALLPAAGQGKIPVSPPDWEHALRILRQMNSLHELGGRRVSSLIRVDGFEPWWFVQDRLYRFYLLPFTRFREFLRASYGCQEVRVEQAPRDLARLTGILSGREGFPRFLRLDQEEARRSVLGGARYPTWAARAAPSAITWASLILFRLLRRDTVLYIIDQLSPGLDHDFRLSPLYRELHARGYRVAEYAHTLSARTAVANSLRRRRPVAFVEAFGELSDPEGPLEPIPMSPPSPGEAWDFEMVFEHALVPVVMSWCRQSAARYRRICRAIKFQGAKRAIILDDNRHNHELVAACKRMGIKVLGFQHGVLNRFHTGLMAYGFGDGRRHDFDRYGLWGPVFVERLSRDSNLFEPGRLFVAGPLRPPPAGGERHPVARPQAGGIRHVLLVSEPLARRQEVLAYLRPLRGDPHYQLHVKLRPGELDQELKAYGLDPREVDIVQTASVYDAFDKADVVIGTYSSVLYEAALALRPIVWLKTSMAYGAELVQEGLAEVAPEPEGVKQAIERAVRLPVDELKRRRQLIWNDARRSGVETLLNRAEEDLWDPPRGKRRA
ncbi:MAG: hypothetical protein ABSF61_01260 [Anaerolineales bacterium]|jgi:hypothetical protein